MAALRCDRLAQTISAFAVNEQGMVAALATCESNEVLVFERQHDGTERTGWRESARLEGHEATVAALSFFQSERNEPDKLASASHDRNSFVYERQAAAGTAGTSVRHTQEWLAGELVVTKLGLAGVCLDTSGGKKIAIGSSEAVVSLLYWDASKRLWAPRLIRQRHQSTVMDIAWHPSGAVLATVSSDNCLRLLNGVVPAVDGSLSLPALGSSRLGDVLLQQALRGGWGLAVAFSPDGSTLAAASQGSQLLLLSGLDMQEPGTWAQASTSKQALQLPGLPLKCLTFLSDGVLVGGGFDFRPLVFRRQQSGSAWSFERHLEGLRQPGPGKAAKPGKLAARIHMFESQAAAAAGAKPGSRVPTALGPANGARADSSSSSSVHENCIISIQCLPPTQQSTLRFLTASLDGRVAEWEVPA